MGHQQCVMSAIVQRAKSAEVLTRPDRLYGFLDAVTSSLTVDEELDSLSALTSLATTAAGVDDSRISFMVMPWAAAPADSNKVVPSDEAVEVFTRLRADTPLDGEDDAEAADTDASSGGVTLTLGLDIEDAVPADEGGTATDENRADDTSDEGSQVMVDSAGDMCG